MHSIQRILYTKTFLRQYEKFWWKLSVDRWIFSRLMMQDINKQIRYLNRPFLKIKWNLFFKALRIVTVYDDATQTLIPILITDKNDKQYGENMIRSSVVSQVMNIYKDNIQDIAEEKYEVVQIS